MSESEGKRLTLLRETLKKSLDKMVSSASFDKAAKEFPHLLGADRSGLRLKLETVKSCYEQVLESISASTTDEFEHILDEFKIKPYLNKLDELCVASRPNESATVLPRRIETKDDVAEVVRQHQTEQLKQDNKRLREVLDEINASNTKIEIENDQKREKLRKIQEDTESKADTLLEIVQTVESSETQRTLEQTAAVFASS
eukprot:m.263117 g.263117  ORF g.263117 m.263117 type:complete len:200 (-) comp48735_c0_seq1:130-729(-)